MKERNCEKCNNTRKSCPLNTIDAADKAYDADAMLAFIERKGAKAVIPFKAMRKVHRRFDCHHYRNSNVIERFFANLKQFRRVATRYDKLASLVESFVLSTAPLLCLK